ncbi:unnamed protein product [Peronospora destructor]|uniref:Uncharacterized protein n=1 Tax=Peronospora destructor TaxID=86335 RepID=A0AAV0TAH4_9STRA|nr:unnamed protein product [Peronospora destructor]
MSRALTLKFKTNNTNVKKDFTEDELDEFVSESTNGKGGKDNKKQSGTGYKSSINTKERLNEDDEEDQIFPKSVSKPKNSVSGEENVKKEMLQVETEEDDEDTKSSKKMARKA